MGNEPRHGRTSSARNSLKIQDKNDERAYNYMDLQPGQTAEDIPLGFVFIGSCTNARLSDLIEAAKYVKGGKVPDHIQAMVVPGSRTVP